MITRTPTLPTRTRSIRRAHTVASHPAARLHRREVARWALAHGRPLDRDVIAAIVALRSDPSTGRLDTSWSDDDLAPLVLHELPLWCTAHGVAAPTDVMTTLDTYLRFLAAHRQFGSGSSPVAHLRRSLADLPRSAGRNGHPAAGRRRDAPVVPIS